MMRQVLIIDDENIVVSALKALFTNLGYKVRSANDGKEGIKVFNTIHDFDMIFTDIIMPGMDGNEVARHIRSSDKSSVPIIAMSGYDNKADNKLFNFSIKKPFYIQGLKDMIKSIERGQKAAQGSQADWRCHA
jgi:CheY-like chemotaxis protein